jgi:hypothetical protein
LKGGLREMNFDIQEEIQEKLKLIEKELNFSKKIPPPQKIYIFTGVILCLLAIIKSLGNINFWEIAFHLVLGGIFIAIYFGHKKNYNFYSNACDIINYYKNIDTKE